MDQNEINRNLIRKYVSLEAKYNALTKAVKWLLQVVGEDKAPTKEESQSESVSAAEEPRDNTPFPAGVSPSGNIPPPQTPPPNVGGRALNISPIPKK